MPELFIDRPGQPRRTYALEKDVITLGKRSECDVLLDSPFVSRTHARIEQSGEGYAIVDPGSLNGVMLNGQRIEPNQPYELVRSAQIVIAEFTLTYWDVDEYDATVRWQG